MVYPILLLLLSLITLTSAIMSSPEPMIDPLAGEQSLFVTPAGRNPSPMVPLTLKTRNTICPSDYPQGFSIRCVVRRPLPKKVVFRLNGKRFRTEFRPPYFVAGDYRGFVNPLRIKRSFSVGCKVRGWNVWAVVRLKC